MDESNYGYIEFQEEGSSDEMEDSSEVSSEELPTSEEFSSEIGIPEETIAQIKDLHTIGIMGLAMFGTIFFLWVFDFLYKKLSHFF